MFKWKFGGTLLVWGNGASIPEGYTEVRDGVYKPDCAACIFRRFSTYSSNKQPAVDIHCLKLQENVTPAQCNACPHQTMDRARLSETTSWVVPRPQFNAEKVKTDLTNYQGGWLECKHRKKTKTDCKTCVKRVCMNEKAMQYKQVVQITDCANCEVRECK